MLIACTLALVLGQDIAWKKSWPETLQEAKASRKLAVLVFWQDKRQDCVRFQKETLSNADVIAIFHQYVCARLDPEGTDEENLLWQKHGEPLPPMTFIYDPEGVLLTMIRTLNRRMYGEALAAANTVYFQEIQPLSTSLARDPQQPEKAVNLAAAYAKIENAVQSSRWYASAVDLHLSRGDKQNALKVLAGWLEGYYERKWYPQARGCCTKISELDPADEFKLGAKAAWMVGMANCAERKWKDAIFGLKSACERYPKAEILDKMMFTLGSAYMYAKDKDNALAIFDAIVSKFPNTESSRLAEVQASKLRGK